MEKKVLIVDDEESIKELLKRVLEIKGYTVVEFSSVTDLLSYLGSFPDVFAVISDVEMPGKDGYNLYEILSSRHPRLFFRTAFITGNPHSEPAKKLADAHMPIFHKPKILQGVLAFLGGIE